MEAMAIEDMHNLYNLKTEVNNFLKNQKMLNGEPTIGLTHKTTQGKNRLNMTHHQCWICYYGLFSDVW